MLSNSATVLGIVLGEEFMKPLQVLDSNDKTKLTSVIKKYPYYTSVKAVYNNLPYPGLDELPA